MERRINNLNQQELDRCKADPCYFYNTYIRLPDQPELSPEAFAQKQAEWKDQRLNHRQLRANMYRNYPLTPNDCIQP